MNIEKCCKPGDYSCTIPMPIKGRVRGIDVCIADIVAALNAANITTVASCCGHGINRGSIILDDGNELIVRKFDTNNYTGGDSDITKDIPRYSKQPIRMKE